MWLDLDLAIGEKSRAPWRACLEKMYWCGAGGSPGEDTLARLVHFYRQRVSMYVCCSAHKLTFGARENSGKSKGGRQRKPPRAPTPTATMLPRKHKDRHENQNQTLRPDQAEVSDWINVAPDAAAAWTLPPEISAWVIIRRLPAYLVRKNWES